LLRAADYHLYPENLGRVLAAHTPEITIIVNKAATAGSAWSAVLASSAASHAVLGLTGCHRPRLTTALDAGVTCPDWRAVAFQADGSGLYTVRSLWSMVHENAGVTVVVCANRR
jgi:acetolactate synthase-1/2/3 large subunit